MTGCMVRLIPWMIGLTTMATIISLNTYADYKVQTVISLAIFITAFLGGVCYFKSDFKENSGILTLFAIMVFVSLHAYGFGVICLFKQFECGAEFIKNIATYQSISQNVLNVLSAILVSLIGFFTGGIGVSPGPKDEYF